MLVRIRTTAEFVEIKNRNTRYLVNFWTVIKEVLRKLVAEAWGEFGHPVKASHFSCSPVGGYQSFTPFNAVVYEKCDNQSINRFQGDCGRHQIMSES